MVAADRLTVSLLAQAAETVHVGNDTPLAAFERAETHGYDWMPLRDRDGQVTRLVSRSELQRLRDQRTFPDVRRLGRPISVRHLISLESPIHVLVRRLADEPFLCCLGPNGVEHVVTRWDLAHPGAQQFAFGLALVVEAELGACLTNSMTESDFRKVIATLDESNTLRTRGEKWMRRTSRKEGLGFVESLTFGQKMALLDKSADARRRLSEIARGGLWERHQPHRLRADLDEIRKMRNGLGHAAQQVPARLRTRMEMTHDLAHALVAGRRTVLP